MNTVGPTAVPGNRPRADGPGTPDAAVFALPDAPVYQEDALRIAEWNNERVAVRHPEFAGLTGWSWCFAAGVDLLVGYHDGPCGLCTLYVSGAGATIWAPGPDGRPGYLDGTPAEIAAIAFRIDALSRSR